MRARTVGTTAAMGGLTVIEKIVAAGRHVLLAALFGAGAMMDSLVVGVSVAELLVALLTGSFLVIFIPLYSGWREAEGVAVADARGLNLILLMLVVLGGAAMALAWGGGRLAAWVGYGFASGQKAMAAGLMPWLAVFVWATGLAILVTGLYHVRGRFLAPQVAQLVGRVVILLVIVALAPRLGIRSVVVALALGAAVLAGILVAGAWWRRGWQRPQFQPRSPEVKTYIVLFLPLLGAAVVDQAVLFTDRIMATMLQPGAVSALYYASVLWGLPVALLSTNFCTVLFPRLSTELAAGDSSALEHSLAFGLRSMVVVMMGATVLLVVLAQDFTGLVLMRGQFDAPAAHLTGAALAALALCLVFQGMGNVVNTALFAARRTGLVAACGVGRVILNVLFNLLLVGPLGAVGIALSTSLTLAAWLAIIWVPFRREMRSHGVVSIMGGDAGAFLGKTAVAALLALAVTMGLASILAGDNLLMRLARLGLAGTMGGAVYGFALILMRVPEATAALSLLRRRLGGKRVAA